MMAVKADDELSSALTDKQTLLIVEYFLLMVHCVVFFFYFPKGWSKFSSLLDAVSDFH